MIGKATLYSGAKSTWILLVLAVAVATYVGVAEPVLSTSVIPGPTWVIVPVAVVAAALGWTGITVLETRAWVSAGRRAGLTPSGGGGILRKPELSGEIGGRPVSASTYTKKVGSGRSSSKKRFTVVEAELDDPETGVLIRRKGDVSGRGFVDRGAPDAGSAYSVGNYDGTGESEELVASLLTERIRAKLDEVAHLGTVVVGDVSTTLPDMGSGFFESMFESAVTKTMPGDGSGVSSETEGLLLDGAELGARAEAFAAVADAFEDARTDDEWGGSSFDRLEDEA